MKMLVGGAGQIKMTKDGKVLLDEMQIQHPTAAIIARTATAQDDITGDGTSSNVLFTGELMKQSERLLQEKLHPRVLVEGIELARDETLKFLETYKTEVKEPDTDIMMQVARTSLRTKLPEEWADHLTPIVTKAVETIREPGKPIDLFMIETMHMRHKTALDSQFIDGLVLDHGTRHPDMAKRLENAYVLVCNVSLEYEKSTVNAGFFYKSAEERARLVTAERKYTDDKVWQIVKLKQRVIDQGEGPEGKEAKGFIVINQKGIDPPSLEILQRHGISAVRRAKRRNMERLVRACGGMAVNSVDDLTPDMLGFCKSVHEYQLGDDVYTFVEGCRHPTSCTILLRGPNDHTIAQLKDAVRDGVRAVLNVIEDQALVAGAGAFEIAAYRHLTQKFIREVSGRTRLGVQAFADSLLCIPKTLAENSGIDAQSALLEILAESEKGAKHAGLCVETGKPILADKKGIWDNYRVKKQFLHLGCLIAVKLLLVDEVIRAGRKMGKE